MKNKIDQFLKGQLNQTERLTFQRAMAEDAELEYSVLQRQLELLIVEELDRQHWLRELNELATLHQSADLLENLVTEELDARHWQQTFSEWEATEQQADELESLVSKTLDEQHWLQQFEQWEAEEQQADQLENLVEKQLDDQYWLQQLEQFAEEEIEDKDKEEVTKRPALQVAHKQPVKQRGRIIRMIGYAAAAAAVLIFGVFQLIPILTETDPTEIRGTDFNTRDGSKLTDLQVYSLADLPGDWLTTFEQMPGVDMRVELGIESSNTFTITATMLNQTGKYAGEVVTGGGNWTVDERNLVLNLNTATLNGSNPRATGMLMIWLNKKRLFKQPVEIVDVNEDFMILNYDDQEGVEFTKKREIN